jgi:hypothetical protein
MTEMSSSQKTSSMSKEDLKKLGLLKQLNQILESFAKDVSFQLDLQKPMVRNFSSTQKLLIFMVSIQSKSIEIS